VGREGWTNVMEEEEKKTCFIVRVGVGWGECFKQGGDTSYFKANVLEF
jgi:hypothetical protein